MNELDGVTVMVEVLPDVAPGLTERLLGLLEREKLVLLPLGACQKSPHPARSGRAARKSPAHLACLILARLIAAPRGLDCGPDSPMPIALANSARRFLLTISGADFWPNLWPVTSLAARSAQNTSRHPQLQGIARHSSVSRWGLLKSLNN